MSPWVTWRWSIVQSGEKQKGHPLTADNGEMKDIAQQDVGAGRLRSGSTRAVRLSIEIGELTL